MAIFEVNPGSMWALIYIMMFLVLLIVTFLATWRHAHRALKAKQLLAEFSAVTSISSSEVDFPERLAIARGFISYTRIETPRGALRSGFDWYGERREETTSLPLRDLCAQTPIIVKYGPAVNALIPAVRVLKGRYRDIIISCVNTTDIHVERRLELIYSEGYARSYLNIESGKIKVKTEWIHYLVETEATHTPVRTLLEVCYAKSPIHQRLECIPLMESNRTGTIEQTINYPIVKKILFGHLSGVGFENLEELLAKFPHIFALNNTIIRLRVMRGSVVLGESTTQLS